MGPRKTNGNGHRKRELVALTQGQVEALVDACSLRAASGLRDAAMIATAWAGALRVSELLAVAPRDLDLEKRLLLVRDDVAKRGSGGLVALDRQSVGLLSRWLERRHDILKSAKRARRSQTLPLFCGISTGTSASPDGNIGGALHANQVRAMLRRRALRANKKGGHVPLNVVPHAFRHGCARALDQAGHPLAVITKQLRHASPSTTDTYLRELRGEDAFAALTRRGDED